MPRYKKQIGFLLLVVTVVLFASNYLQAQQSEPNAKQSSSSLGYRLSPEKYEKAVAYARSRYQLYFIGTGYGLLVLFLILSFRIGPVYRNWAEAMSSRRFTQLAIFVPLLIFTISIVQIPLDVYGHSLSLHYEQSIQPWLSWFWDRIKEQLIVFVVATIVVWILYGVIRRSPKLWWFYFWLASLPLIVFLLFVAPLVIDPLFYKFEPLEKTHPDLVAEIEKVVKRGGLEIPRERMFEMKASEKSKSVNAYVTGFSASKRVVVWDTTIQKMTHPQTLFVFGHEMGHYVLHHIPKTIVFIAVLLFIFLYAGSVVMRRVLSKKGATWGIRNLDDFASLPVLILFFSIFSFFATPVISTYSRGQEHDADIYGLEVIHGIIPDSQQVAAESFQILGEINLSDPDPNPFIKFWLYSHPPLNERLIFARDYDPKTARFVK